MPANAVSIYLTYANLQMAAEAIFAIGFTQGAIPVSTLTLGNNRSSKFTATQAAQFATEWEVVAHQPNTSTGFSGTLFTYTGQDDPTRGLVNGQLVMSFRSTEFVDDAARDSEATNLLEIKEHGWAFGQIADMEQWFAELNADPTKLQGKSFTVTGYSLGGHLATAFNLLHQAEASRITATYTFNGAGVGELVSGTLSQALDGFTQARDNGSESAFTTDAARNVYLQWRGALGASATSATMAQALGAITVAQANASTDPELSAEALAQTLAELDRLYQAVRSGSARLNTIRAEISGSAAV